MFGDHPAESAPLPDHPQPKKFSIVPNAPPFTELDDDALIVLARGGEHSKPAFDELMRRHGSEAFAVAYGVLDDPQDAEDAVQEAFEAVWISLPRYQRRDGSSFKAYLFSIVRYKAIDLCRQRKRLRLAQTPIDERTQDALSLTEEDQIVERSVIATSITAALETLSPTERFVFEKWAFAGLQPRDISEASGMSGAAVRTALHRAKQRLRPYLRGIDAAEGAARRRSPKGTGNDDTLQTARGVCDQPCYQYPDCRCAMAV